jgi:hypothetical protein
MMSPRRGASDSRDRAEGKRPEKVLGIARNSEGNLDLRDLDLKKCLLEKNLPLDALKECHFEKVTFGDREWDKPAARLANISFERSVFENASFANVQMENVYFRGCMFKACDLRYIRATGTSFQEGTFQDCDFYRAHFSAANVFTDATFDPVSLDKAWLDGTSGLTRGVFDRIPSAMVQERAREEYAQFLERTKNQRPSQHSVDQALEEAPRDAAEVYRSLSGVWTSQGQLDDAGFAYVTCKRLERQFLNPWRTFRVNHARKALNDRREHLSAEPRTLNADDKAFADSPPDKLIGYGGKGLMSWMWLVVAGLAAKHGESWLRPFGWLVTFNFLLGVTYSWFGGVQTEDLVPVNNVFKCWLFSLEQLTTSSGQHLQSTSSLVDLIGSLQTMLGVTLLGVLGFALANRLRSA